MTEEDVKPKETEEAEEEEEEGEEEEEEEEEPVDDGVLKFDADGNVSVDESAGAPGAAEAADPPPDTASMGVRRHERSSPYGGMLNHPGAEADAGLKSIALGIVREAGKKLFSGQMDLLNMSLPVGLFEPRSYLRKLTDSWAYPHMLDMALSCYEEGKFVEGMKWIIAFNVAGCHHAFNHMKKPFNPLLGETFQGKYAGTGGTVNLEQISHHPPVSAFSVQSPNGGWIYTGCSEPVPAFKGNSIKTFGYGRRAVVFPGLDTEIQLNFPDFHVKNIVMGQLRGDLGGEVRVLDRKNKLAGISMFGPNKIDIPGKKGPVKVMDAVVGQIDLYENVEDMPTFDDIMAKKKVHKYKQSVDEGGSDAGEASKAPTTLGGRFNSFFGVKKKSTPDAAGGKTPRTARKTRRSTAGSARRNKTVTCVSKYCGSWVSHMDFDDVRYWNLYNENEISPGSVTLTASSPPELVSRIVADEIVPLPEEVVMPTDCRFRNDIRALSAEDSDLAQLWKHEIEVRQRRDAKSRVAGGGVDV